MSLHKSFGKNRNLTGQRNVLNRIEKIKQLKEKGLWTEKDSVFGLPKIKIIKLKEMKKGKKVEEEKKEETNWDNLKK